MNKQDIINYLNTFSNLNSKWKNKDNWSHEQITTIKKHVPFYDDIKAITELKYCLKNDITKRPSCPVCKKEVSFLSGKDGKYRFFCCKECGNSKEGKEVYKKYKSKIMTELNKDVKYRENLIKKSKQTKLQKYGDENYNNIEQCKKTKLKKYGDENYCNKEQISISNKNKTDTQKYKIREKRESTNLKTHNVKYHFNKKSVLYKVLVNRRIKTWDTFNLQIDRKKLKRLFEYDNFIDPEYKKFNYECLRCGNVIETNSVYIQKISCGCYTSGYQSHYELEIIDFLKENNITNYVHGQRERNANGTFGYELDVYLPELKLGIEFHGLYWHSDQFKSKTYHYDKYKHFVDKDIQIIQIFENEWNEKQDIVKSILKSKLGLNKRIYGRKCEVKEISVSEYRNFLDTNHLQGYVASKIKIGLFYQNELVSCIGIGKSRFNKKYQHELLRLATKMNFSVIGGFSKMLTYFSLRYSPQNLLTYVDLRYFNGKGYLANDFEEISISAPNYFYFRLDSKYCGLENRMKYQKYKLNKLLSVYNESLNEYQNMIANDYYRIFDAGNKVFVKKFK